MFSITMCYTIGRRWKSTNLPYSELMVYQYIVISIELSKRCPIWD